MSTHYVEIPGSAERISPRQADKRSHRMVAGGAMIFACCALLALAVSSSDKGSDEFRPASFAERAASYAAKPPHKSILDEAPANATDAAPSMNPAAAGGDAAAADPNSGKLKFSIDKIKFPTSWEAFQETFGGHMWWTFFVLFLALLTWVYVRFIRPRLIKDEVEDNTLIDENDVTADLIQIPGEEIYFRSEEPFTSSAWETLLCGCGNRVWKLAVTNKRIVAQKRESTCFGTCQLTAREDCWPVENVSKVSVISGEFWGYTIPNLWDMAAKYLVVTLVFDLAHGIVRETVKDLFGPEASDPSIAKLIWAINLGFYVICNVLFVLAIIYSIAVMALLIWPHSLVKVYLTKEMEEDGSPIHMCCGCTMGGGNSKPMETFTFKTGNSYKAYQAIMAARAGAGKPISVKTVANP